ncbi:MAG: rod shape-determining protein MreC [Candidatus Omnitrophica bacterium]|nr:rod shape-determining protein MreC [Candidatus Omnitrophota bacterium]
MSKILTRHRNRLISFIILSALALLIFNSPFFYVIKNTFLFVVTSPKLIHSNVKGYIIKQKDLINKYSETKKDLLDAILIIDMMQDLREENKRLKELLEFKDNFSFTTVLAQVLARDPDPWKGSLILSAGKNNGLSVQDAVCSSKGLIGKIVDVSDKRSTVILLMHPNFRTGGIVKKNRINGVIRGDGTNTVKMIYIPLDADVKVGSVVTTSNLSSYIPKGIRIGVIEKVRISETGLYKVADIKPFADLYNEEEVLCVIKENE